ESRRFKHHSRRGRLLGENTLAGSRPLRHHGQFGVAGLYAHAASATASAHDGRARGKNRRGGGKRLEERNSGAAFCRARGSGGRDRIFSESIGKLYKRGCASRGWRAIADHLRGRNL